MKVHWHVMGNEIMFYRADFINLDVSPIARVPVTHHLAQDLIFHRGTEEGILDQMWACGLLRDIALPTCEQPQPKKGGQDVTPVVREMFLDLLAARERKGIETYGTTLQTHNGRDPLKDALDELIDAVQYVVQAIMERKGTR